MSGILYGVGVGPGDPELLTLKAVRVINSADLIALPSKDLDHCIAYQIAKKAIPSLQEKEFLFLDLPMTKQQSLLEQAHDQCANHLCALLQTGKTIAFLTLGDPTVYSTYLYLHQRITNLGYETHIINGIPSFCAAASAVNTSLVENAQCLHIYPSSYPVEEAFHLSGTKVFMKSAKNYPKIKKQLLETQSPFYMIENCGMNSQKIYTEKSTLPDEASYLTLFLMKD